MSGYKTVIDSTTQTIDVRARYFRNLIVAVVGISFGSVALALVMWTFSPLGDLLLLFPLCGLFFCLDDKLLSAWRSEIVNAWIRRDIDLKNFSDSVSAIPILPKNTLRGMLETLPLAGDPTAEKGMSSSVREALALTVSGIHARQSDFVMLKATASAILAGSVVVAILSKAWPPLLFTLTAMPLFFIGKWLERTRVRRSRERFAITREKPDFNEEKYLLLVSHFQSAPWRVD